MTFLEAVPIFKRLWIQQDIDNYSRRDTAFIGGPEGSIKRIVDFRKREKGCELWLEGDKYPVRTHASGQKVMALAQAKRLIPMLFATTKRKVFLAFNMDLVIDWLHHYLKDVYLEENQYNQPVRELYRIIRDQRIRDIVCAICEYDTAYRFRLQDVIVHIEATKTVTWNINRMVDLLIEREQTEAMKNKWRKMRSITWLFRLHPALHREMNRLFEEVDVREMQSSVEDRYHQATYKDYHFEGLSYEQRQSVRNSL